MAEAGSDDRSRYRAPVGTHDVLPPESSQWIALVAAFAERAGRFGFDLVITPIFEHLEVFQRVGESTDVVRKEMYDFEDKGGRRIALATRGHRGRGARVRAAQPGGAVEGLVRRAALPLRATAEGPVPPALPGGGRSAGVDDPQLDVEVIALAHGFYRALGLARVHAEHQLDG